MTQTMSIRIDSDAKKEMSKVCKEIGLTISSAFNIFARKVAKEKRIPFDLEVDPFYSATNIKYLKGVIEDIETGKAKLVAHKLHEVK